MKEIWKPIPGYENLYLVSNRGKVKNKKTNKILKLQKTKKGYLKTQLYIYPEKRIFSVHRLVAEVFLNNSEQKPQVNHINGIKTDNRVENLEWSTSLENMNHAVKNNLVAKGPNHGTSKLTKIQVLEIRKLSSLNWKPINLAKKFGVTRTNVLKIVSKKTWKHI